MADQRHDPTVWDGRFGEYFDDEVSSKAVSWTLWGVGLMTALFMIAMIFFVRFLDHRIAAERPASMAVTFGEVPDGPPLPRLQAKPEDELIAMRHQMVEHLDGWGWVDRDAGVVHMPIEQALSQVLENGLPSAAPIAPVPETTELEVGELPTMENAG